MRRALLLSCAALLAGCGYKGDLVLPDKTPAEQPAAPDPGTPAPKPAETPDRDPAQ